MKKPLRFLVWGLLGLMLLVFTVNSFLATGGDFPVFWRAVGHYLGGEKLYDLARDGGHCYKYPPWVTVGFIPFGIFRLRIAEALWRLTEVAALVYSIRWCMRRSFQPILAAALALPFWGTWMNNIVWGQMTPVLLALALAGFDRLERGRNLLGTHLIFNSLTAKIFNLFALVGIPRKRWNLRAIAVTAATASVLTIPALAPYGWNPIALVRAYQEMLSHPDGILGGGFYGLPALVVSLLGWPGGNPAYLAKAAVIAIAAILPFYFWIAAGIRQNQALRFSLALGLACAVHPLAFSYTFVLAYPLAALAADRLWNPLLSGKSDVKLTLARTLLVIGVFSITLVTSKFLGTFADTLNGITIKSLGILMIGLSIRIR